MPATAYTFIAGLPAVLGFGAFIFHLFLRHRGAANTISSQTLDLVKARSRNLPELDARLNDKQVFSLLKTDENLRKVFTTEELKILESVGISERRQQWFAFIFLSGTVTLSLILYLVLVWKPWERPSPHPINHFAVDFSMSRPITADMEEFWQILKKKAQTSLDTGDSRKQQNEGFIFSLDPKRSASGLNAYTVGILPQSPISNYIMEEAQPREQSPNIGAMRLAMFIATFIFTDNAIPKDVNALQIDALNKKRDFSIVSGVNTASQPLYLELDFLNNRYRVSSPSHVPMIVSSENWARTWEDLHGLNLVVIMDPGNGEGWALEFIRFHSELGIQYSLSGKAIVTHDRSAGLGASSRIFTASLP